MNPLLRPREIAHYLTDSGAALLLAGVEAAAAPEVAGGLGVECVTVEPGGDLFRSIFHGAEPARQVVTRDGGDTAVLLYTSGTTGTPKGAELTHANLLGNARLSARELLSLKPDDVVLGCLPLFHVFGQTCGLNATIGAGATLTLLPRFDAGRVLDILARDRVTVFAGVPTMYSALLQHPKRESAATLRLCVSGGSALPLDVLRSFEAAYDIPILEGYGLSETSPVVAFNLPGRRKEGSIGRPVDGVAVRVLDRSGADVPTGEVGELVVRGHNVMKAYWGNPEATAAVIVDGWFHTGDLGMADEDGYLYITGRIKDMIIRGGYNVYAREIEEAIYEHPAVYEAAVLGVPDPALGEEVAAAVVLHDGADATSEELREFIKARVAPYKYPRLIRIVASLPKGPTGKILKREIRLP
jgi:long-chain acyl-CoA synthetase